jgi:hypothetical protein
MLKSELIEILKDSIQEEWDCEIAIDDGTEMSPLPIKSISNLMDGYLLLLTYE